MGGNNSKDKQEKKKEKVALEAVVPAPLFVPLPHFNQDFWPTFKEVLSANIVNGKQLDVCSSSIPPYVLFSLSKSLRYMGIMNYLVLYLQLPSLRLLHFPLW
jgi:hypothetical protein